MGDRHELRVSGPVGKTCAGAGAAKYGSFEELADDTHCWRIEEL